MNFSQQRWSALKQIFKLVALPLCRVQYSQQLFILFGISMKPPASHANI